VYGGPDFSQKGYLLAKILPIAGRMLPAPDLTPYLNPGKDMGVFLISIFASLVGNKLVKTWVENQRRNLLLIVWTWKPERHFLNKISLTLTGANFIPKSHTL
jgi:hypothetical protein